MTKLQQDWIAGLQLQHRHEAAYAAYLTENLRAAQIEVDVLLLDLIAGPCRSMLDLGANIGFVALSAMMRGFDRILCFEPEPTLFARLSALTSNHLTALPFAVGASAGIVDFYVSQTHNQGHTVDAATIARFRPIFGKDMTRIHVPMVTLDETITAPFDYWKIDVEGHEVEVLLGARETLRRFAPRLISVEIYEQDRLHAISLLLPSYHAFQVFVMQDAPRLQVRPVKTAEIQTLDGAAIHAPTFLFVQDGFAPIAALLDMVDTGT